MSAPVELGPCCLCETTRGVCNVVVLTVKGLVPGHGWGCFKCGLPNDGAVAVLCDPCERRHESGTAIRFACCGYPATDGRVSIVDLTIPHHHDYTLHPELHGYDLEP